MLFLYHDFFLEGDAIIKVISTISICLIFFDIFDHELYIY